MNFEYDNETINTIKKMLTNTTSGSHYNGWNNRTTYGYHSFNISNIKLLGQRQPWIRLNKIKKHYDFTDKTIIDFGCNTGGMVFHLPELKRAIGLDFNKDCIDACNYISSVINCNTKYLFKQQDLNIFNLKHFLKDNNIDNVDVIFLLSLGSWINNWKALYTQCLEICDNIILETNNDKEGIPQLKLFENLNCLIKVIDNSSHDDTTNNFSRKTYLITKKNYPIKKIFVNSHQYHFKNMFFIDYFISRYHIKVNNIQEADIIYSPHHYINIEHYPTKKFIFGPHFSVFPNNIVRKFNNIHNNAIYIQPSQPSVDTWQKEFNFNSLPMKAIPFGVDTEKFKPNINIEKTNVILYYKSRDPNEFNLLTKFLNNKNITYKVFSYQDKYNENHFLEYLKTCKYGVVLGRHESQGFAIQEMLSCNLPLLVWGVTLRNQEYPYIKDYVQIKSKVSTVPYWNTECGELFHNYSELENTFNKFIKNIDNYNPRKFILENLSMDKCVEKWNSLLYEIYNN